MARYKEWTDGEFVYALAGSNGHVRYVGRSENPVQRLKLHGYAKTALGDWVRAEGPTLVILEFCPWPKSLDGPRRDKEREKFWIETFVSSGANLFNIAHTPKCKQHNVEPNLGTLKRMRAELDRMEADREDQADLDRLEARRNANQ